MSKWSKTYFADLAERAGTTAIYGLIAMLTADASGAISSEPQTWWVVVGLPTALSLLKGLLANLAHPDSGPSLLPAPPAPDMEHDERGAISVVEALLIVLIVLVILALIGVV